MSDSPIFLADSSIEALQRTISPKTTPITIDLTDLSDDEPLNPNIMKQISPHAAKVKIEEDEVIDLVDLDYPQASEDDSLEKHNKIEQRDDPKMAVETKAAWRKRSPSFDEENMVKQLQKYNRTGRESPDGHQDEDSTLDSSILNLEEDEEHEKLSFSFKTKMKAFEDKKAKVLTDSTDEVEIARLENEEHRGSTLANKKRTAEAAQEAENTNSMFISDDDEVEMIPQTAEETTQPPRKRRRAIGGYQEAIEVMDDVSEDDTINDTRPTRKGRKTASKQKLSKVNQTDSRKKAKNLPKSTPGARPARTPDLLNVQSLMRNNIVADAQANQGQASQPVFAERNRKKALTQLLASIPPEHQKTSKSTAKQLDDACKKFRWKGFGSMHSNKDGKWILKGMTTALYHFQLLGCAWMRDKENGETAPFGGIVADSMGLGKTVSSLCNILEGRPKPTARNKTTLIVTPPALCNQWMAEIQKHFEQWVYSHQGLGQAMIYRAGSIPDTTNPCQILRTFGIIITTYNEVMKQYPKYEPPIHVVTEEGKDEWWKKTFEENKGPLFRMAFHRIILDEAQIIKNHEGRTSNACRSLTSKYRWILSGTPLSNRIEELYPYFEFLGVEGSGSFEAFKNNFCKRDDIGAMRLDGMLRNVMIRRTGADRMFDRPIVTLPALDHKTIQIEFSPIEKAVYQIVRDRFVATINQWSMVGMVFKRKSNIMVMITRLRQISTHVLLVTKCLRELLEAEDIEKISRLMKKLPTTSGNSTGFRNATVLRTIIQEAKKARPEDELESTSTAEPASGEDIGLHITVAPMSLNFGAYIEQLKKDKAFQELVLRSLCHKCRRPPEHKRLSVPCAHMYCKECLEEMFRISARDGTCTLCVNCSMTITGEEEFIELEQLRAEGQVVPGASQDSDEEERNEFAWMDLPGTLMSSKLQAVITQIEKWKIACPQGKIIVFTQWRPIIEVLSRLCSAREWAYCKFRGGMDAAAKARAVHKFQDAESREKIFLASMFSGNLGLNLTAARYVIIIDPWWNEAAEDQAFSRAYRIGQKNNVEVRRFVMKDAIETQFILALQERKTEEIERTLDKRKHEKFDIRSLMKLFGPVERDPDTGQPIITEGEVASGEFVLAEDHTVVDDSDVEDPDFTPARPS